MSFQNQVRADMPSGYPGGWPSCNVYYAAAGIAGADIIPGTFISIGPNTVNPDGIPMNPDIATPGGANATGIALRARPGTFGDPKVEFQEFINEGFPVEAVVRGDVFVVAANATDLAAAVKGAKVFYNTTTGAVSFAAAGATVADSAESAFYVVKVVDAGQMLVFVSTERRG